MPLFETTEEAPQLPSNPNLREEPHRPITVDTKFEHPSTLLTHIEGSKWIAREFYTQYLTNDSESAAQELDRPEVYQQYLRIKNLELRVTSPLQPSQDPTSKEFTIIGTATLFPGIVPKNNDMFLADIGDGRAGIFVVTEIRQMSMLRNTVYEINYELKSYDTEVLLADLRDKITKDTVFVKDFYKYGKNPLLIDSEYEQYQQLLGFKKTLPQMYFDLFYNHDLSTLLVPEQQGSVYDPFLTELMVRLVDRDEHLKWRQVKALNRDVSQHVTISTLWSALYNQDVEILNYCSFESRVISPKHFSASPRFSSIYYSGVTGVYYPKQDKIPNLGDLTPSEERTFNRPIDLSTIVPDELEGLSYEGVDLPSLVAFKPVTEDGYYVLSEAFYKVQYENMSLLEVMVSMYLDKMPVGIKPLFSLCESAKYWGRVEQFYYIPILLLLLHTTIGDIN